MKPISKKQQTRKNTSKTEKQKRLKKCRYCSERNIPYGSIRPFCYDNACIRAHNEKTRASEKRKAKQAHNQGDRKYMYQKAKGVMQKYARLRDWGEPCISCGIDYFKCQIHGGHFRPAGMNSAVVFNLWNINAQCAQCNSGNMKSGNVTEYEIGLIKKIGRDKVEWLKSQTQTHKHDIEYLSRLVKIFSKKILMVKRRKGIK